MNDDFLHALRRDPPAEFARGLKRRLDRIPARRGARSAIVRIMLAMFVIGGVAMAAALLLRNREEPLGVADPIAKQAAPSTPASETRPTVTPQSNRPASSAESSPPPIESESRGSLLCSSHHRWRGRWRRPLRSRQPSTAVVRHGRA